MTDLRTTPEPARTVHKLDLSKIMEQITPAASDVFTFDWFGEEIRVAEDASDTIYVDFVAQVGHLDGHDPAAAIAVKGFMQEMIHPDDFDRFWSLGRKHRISTDGLSQVIYSIIEQISGLPTQQPTDSRGGLRVIDSNSMAGDYKAVREALEEEGRSDLSLIYLEAEGSRGRQADRLTLREVCELAYVTMLDMLERQWHTSMVALYGRSALSEEPPEIETLGRSGGGSTATCWATSPQRPRKRRSSDCWA